MGFLSIRRKLNQDIKLLVPPSDDHREIHIRVLRVDNGSVRIGFDAPKTITVLRGELLEVELEKEHDAHDRQA